MLPSSRIRTAIANYLPLTPCCQGVAFSLTLPPHQMQSPRVSMTFTSTNSSASNITNFLIAAAVPKVSPRVSTPSRLHSRSDFDPRSTCRRFRWSGAWRPAPCWHPTVAAASRRTSCWSIACTDRCVTPALRHQVSAGTYYSIVSTFQRKIMMRMKIDYQINGAQKTELAKVVLE